MKCVSEIGQDVGEAVVDHAGFAFVGRLHLIVCAAHEHRHGTVHSVHHDNVVRVRLGVCVPCLGELLRVDGFVVVESGG